MKGLLLATVSAFALMASPASAGPLALAVAGTASAVSAAGGLAAFTLGSSFATTFGALAANFAVRAVLGYALNSLAAQNVGRDATSRGYQNVNQLGPALPHQIIYGETKIGGVVFYQALTTGTSTDDRLHRVIAFAGHEIESFEAIYLNDIEVTLDGSGNVTAPSQFVGKVRIKQHLGAADQAADSDLVSEVTEWTTAHRAQGVAYLYCRFEDAAAFETGVPVVTAKIRGKKVGTMEWAAHNLLTYSPQFDNAAWTASGVSVTAEATTDPDGGATADQIAEDSAGGQHVVYYDSTIQNSAAEYTIAVWAKDNGRGLQIRPRGRGTGEAFANFDLSAGTVGNTGGTALQSATIEDAGSGWYLCKLRFTSDTDPTVGAEFQLCQTPASDGEEPSYTGDGSSGVYLWGAHFYRDDVRGMQNADGRSDTYVATTTTATANEDVTEAVEWSDNPALCIRDYVKEGFGLSEADSGLNEALFIEAVNDCDAQISGAASYTLNGSFTLEADPEDILRNLLSSMGGVFWNYAGQWAILAAKYRAPALTLDENDLRAPIEVATRHSRRDNFNTVLGQYKGAATDYQPDNYAEVTSGVWLAEDNGIRAASELDLLFTDTEVMAQRIAKTFLRRNRRQVTVTGAFGLRALDLKVGDNVRLSLDHLGWVEKVFEVVDWRLGMVDMDIQVNMILREMSEDVFTGTEATLNDESGNRLLDESGNGLEGIVG